MPPALRKLGLAVHIVMSVGWMGAVAAFAAVAFVGRASTDATALAGVGDALAVIGWAAVVPLALASVVSGIVQSLGTNWGLFRHYWVIFKLVATLVATLLLMLHMLPTMELASAARSGALPVARLVGLRQQLAFDAGAGLLVLLAISALSFYKPRGMTPWGWRASFSA